MRNAYFERGYLLLQLEPPTDPRARPALYRLREGPRFRLTRYVVVEESVPGERSPLPEASAVLQPGWFSRSHFAEACEALLRQYLDAGYPKVALVPETKLDEGAGTIEVVVVVEPGPHQVE